MSVVRDHVERVFGELTELMKNGKFELEDVGFMEKYLTAALIATKKLSARAGLCEVCLKKKAVGEIRFVPGVIVPPDAEPRQPVTLRACAECKAKKLSENEGAVG